MSNPDVELNEHWKILTKILEKEDNISHVLFDVGNEPKAHEFESNIQSSNLLIQKISELLRNKVIVTLGMIIRRPIEAFDLSICFSNVTKLFVVYNGAGLLLASKYKNQIAELTLLNCRDLTQAHINHVLEINSNQLLLKVYICTENIEMLESAYQGSLQFIHDLQSLPIYSFVTINDKEIVVKVGELDGIAIDAIVYEIISIAKTIQVLKIQDQNHRIFYDLQAIMLRKPEVLPEMTDLEVYHILMSENIYFTALFRKKGSLQRFSYQGYVENIINFGGQLASCKNNIHTSLEVTNYRVLCTSKEDILEKVTPKEGILEKVTPKKGWSFSWWI